MRNKRINRLAALASLSLCILSAKTNAQNPADTTFKPSGKLWGYTFGDYYYKAHADSPGRGANQYSGIEQGRNAFQIRRSYLGFNYDIHPRFSAEVLLAAEDNVGRSNGAVSGDLTQNGKLTFYIKNANLRWKNLWQGTDLVVGLQPTPAFSLVEEPVWGYRSVERTITDWHRMPSFDLGAALQGKFDPKEGRFGYNLMVGNGSSARPETNKFKHFYGNVWAKLLDKRLVLSLFSDYERLDWTPGFHHGRGMVKGFAGYTTPAFSAGVEAFRNHSSKDVIGVHPTTAGVDRDTLSADATGISTFMRGSIIKDKLGFFARYDRFNPDTKYNEAYYKTYEGLSSGYEPNTKEQFITAGLDFTPVKNVHLMPNVWYTRYGHERTDVKGSMRHDHDLVYRLTFYYVYGK